ncbi:MAG: hypothetical protein JWM31_55 [Solirubrobacterales bacterium]|nr:hypothetical protein [Solirubrobacterales bacterium]
MAVARWWVAGLVPGWPRRAVAVCCGDGALKDGRPSADRSVSVSDRRDQWSAPDVAGAGDHEKGPEPAY